MSKRHDIVLRSAEDGPNPPDLLQQIVEDVKKLVPEAGKTGRRWVRAKGDEAVARVKEIQARVYKEIGELDIERQRLIQQRDEARQKAELELQKHKDDHRLRQKQLRIEQQEKKVEALHAVVDCIVALKDRGIDVDLSVIKQAEKAGVDLLGD